MYCEKCGAISKEGDSFCRECGANLKTQKSISEGVDTYYRILDKWRYIDDNSKLFKIFCAVMAVISMLTASYGLIYDNELTIVGSVISLVLIGILFLINNVKTNNFHFRLGRQMVVVVFMMVLMNIVSSIL